MQRLLTSALAIAAVGTLGHATNGTDDDWLELDSEINGLASSVAVQGDWMDIKALLRGFYSFSSDELATLDGFDGGGNPIFGDDVSGVNLQDAEINGNFQVGDVKLRLGIDFEDGSGRLQDAFAMYPVNEDFSVRMGRYKPHALRTNFVDPDKQFFPYRSALGSAFDFYDEGVGAFGDIEAFSWSFDVFNSLVVGNRPSGLPNADRSGHLYILRVLWNFGRMPGLYETTPEDAFGSGDELALTVGGSIIEDDVTRGDAGIVAIDCQGTFGRIGFGAEVAAIGDDVALTTQSGWNALALPLAFDDGDRDTTAWALQGNILPTDRFGVGARIESLDNDDNNQVITIAGNMYDAGHAGKLSAAISFIKTDNNAFDDTTVFTVGYTFGASR